LELENFSSIKIYHKEIGSNFWVVSISLLWKCFHFKRDISDEIVSGAILLDNKTSYAAIVEIRILIRGALSLSDLRSYSIQYFVPV